jgi:hypothetical protein
MRAAVIHCDGTPRLPLASASNRKSSGCGSSGRGFCRRRLATYLPYIETWGAESACDGLSTIIRLVVSLLIIGLRVGVIVGNARSAGRAAVVTCHAIVHVAPRSATDSTDGGAFAAARRRADCCARNCCSYDDGC